MVYDLEPQLSSLPLLTTSQDSLPSEKVFY